MAAVKYLPFGVCCMDGLGQPAWPVSLVQQSRLSVAVASNLN